MSSQGDEPPGDGGGDRRGSAKRPSLAHVGGKNSFHMTSRSVRRAANFRQIPSLLHDVRTFLSPGSEDEADEESPLLDGNAAGDAEIPPLASKLSGSAKRRTDRLNLQREESRQEQKSSEREQMTVRLIKRSDGTKTEVIVGQSTMQQTIFNSSNVLIGVGMLGLPLGVSYAGWVIGLVLLIASAFLTKYTASLLAKCVDVDSSLANFGDIAFIAFGETGRTITSILFTLELIAACIALVVLFADSLESLIPELTILQWKVVCGIILLPINFIPMKWLSYSSFIGVFCVLALLVIIIVDGSLKPTSPGSLRDLATTYAFPANWKALPLSFGLIMAPWGGHSVFPNIYRDMRHPWKYERALYYIFSFTTGTDLLMAILGWLMFGKDISDEVTKNVLQTKAYPSSSRIVVLVLIAILPLTKFPLNCSPIVSTMEVIAKIDKRAASIKPNRFNQSNWLKYPLKALFRILTVIVIVLLAILVPSFELISAIMGALFCFLICIIMPVGFHLKMFGDEISRKHKILDWCLIVVCAVLGLLGTVWEFLPKSWIGA